MTSNYTQYWRIWKTKIRSSSWKDDANLNTKYLLLIANTEHKPKAEHFFYVNITLYSVELLGALTISLVNIQYNKDANFFMCKYFMNNFLRLVSLRKWKVLSWFVRQFPFNVSLVGPVRNAKLHRTCKLYFSHFQCTHANKCWELFVNLYLIQHT